MRKTFDSGVDVTRAVAPRNTEFSNVCEKLADSHAALKDLDRGEFHIAMDNRPIKGVEVPMSVLICANVSTMDKFHIMDALMEGLSFTDKDKRMYFMANILEIGMDD